MSSSGPGALEPLARRLRGSGDALRARGCSTLAGILGAVGQRFLVDGDPLRAEALDRIPTEAGLSGPMARRILEGMARDWTVGRLSALLSSEFPDPSVLDGFVAQGDTSDRTEAGGGRRLRALGDRLALHVGAGSVPGVCATSMIRSLLVKTPVLVKPGAGDRALTELFHRGLHEADPELAASVAVVYWAGAQEGWLDEAVRLAERVVVYGSDRAVRSVRDRVPVHIPLVAYHHRTSVAVVGARATDGATLEATAAALAWAASTFDQRGCVSPHRVWVLGGPDDAERLASATADAMAREASVAPAGPSTPAELARVQQLRGSAELRRAAGEAVGVWGGPGGAWTVILEEPGALEAAGVPRTLVVTWARSPGELAQCLAGDGPHLQTVGLAGLGPQERDVVEVLAGLGATRMCPLDEVPFPPAWWLHDGAGPLRVLVRWAEWTR